MVRKRFMAGFPTKNVAADELTWFAIEVVE
jgi:hypothetical protein